MSFDKDIKINLHPDHPAPDTGQLGELYRAAVSEADALKAQVARLTDEIQAANEVIESTRAALGADRKDGAATAARKLKDRLGEYASRNNDLIEARANRDLEIKNLKSRIQTQATELASVRQWLALRAGGHLHEAVCELSNRLNWANDPSTATGADLDRIGEAVGAGLRHSLGETDQEWRARIKGAQPVTQQTADLILASIRDTNQAISENNDALAAARAAIPAAVESVSRDYEEIRSRVETISGLVEDLEKGQRSLQSMANLADHMDETQDAHENRIKALESSRVFLLDWVSKLLRVLKDNAGGSAFQSYRLLGGILTEELNR